MAEIENIQQPPQIATVAPQEDESNGMQITDILELFLHNWKWFVLSACIFLAGAYIKVNRSIPIYSRSAQILIKEDSKKGAFSGNVDWFATLGVGSSVVTVQNEMVAIQSPATFMEVVRRLDLNTTYQRDGSWYDVPLYGKNLPVKVTLPDLGEERSGSFDMRLYSDGRVELSNMVGLDGPVEGKKLTAKVGQTLTGTPLGTIVLEPGPAMMAFSQGTGDMLIHVAHTSVLAAAKAAAGHLSAVLNGKENSIIDLTYSDPDTRRAEDIITTLIDSYNDAWVADKDKMTHATNDFIMKRLEVIQEELAGVDNSISSFKSENLVPNPLAQASLHVSNANEADKRATEINNQLYMAKYVRDFVADDKNKMSLLPANVGIGSNSVESLLNQYNVLLLERNRLITNTNAQNPIIVDADQKLTQQRQAILSSIDNQINLLNTQLASLRRTESKANAGIASTPKQEKFLLSVERQQKVKESLYLFLLQKREENELSLSFTAYNTRVITPPMGSNAPVSPNSNRIYMIALAIGLAIPAVLFYLLEITNSRVRGRKDLEKLNVPFIGEIPLVGHRPRKKGLRYWMERIGIKKAKVEDEKAREIMVKNHSRNIINEAFRVVRTNIDFMTAGVKGGQLVMVTSANPGSGKTYISGNLAASFGLKGKKVLLLDFDLRRASASLYVSKPKKGVSAYLTGKTDDWKSLVMPMEGHENMDILPAGTLPPNPAELLADERTATLLKELREAYDVVFIDCPPIEIVADASIIAKLVDRTIFVVRVDLMEREMLPVVDKYYKEEKFNGMSLLLNGSMSAYGKYGYHRYGYRYGYGYGYSYGYGYGYGYGHGGGDGYTQED